MFSLRQFLDRSFKMPEVLVAKFQRLHHDIEHLHFCSHLISKHKLMLPNSVPHDNDDNASRCMQSFDKFINTARERLAIDYLNKAIPASRGCRENLSRAYRMRAALCYALDDFSACLVNLEQSAIALDGVVQFSVENEFDTHVRRMVKMMRREKSLVRLYHTQEAYIMVPFLMTITKRHTFNHTVRLRRSTFGPQVVFSANDLPPGQVIGVDVAINHVLVGAATNRRCTHCLTENILTMIPCSRAGCTAMFCNETCRKWAFDATHRYECQLTPYLRKHEECRPVVRLVLSTFRTQGQVRDMMLFHRICSLRVDNALAYAERPNRYLDANGRLAIALTRQMRVHSSEERFYFARVASLAYALIKQHTFVVEVLFQRRRQRRFLRQFIYNAVTVLCDVGYEVQLPSTCRFDDELSVMQPVSHCLFPVTALMQHSCTANLGVIPFGEDTLAVYTVRPIKAGEPLTIDRTYCPPGSRQLAHKKYMRTQLFLECDCPDAAPVHLPFPNEGSLARTELTPTALWDENSPEMLRLFSDRRSKVFDLLKQTVDFQKKYANKYPCLELWAARRCFELCLKRLIMPPMLADYASDDLSVRRQAAESYWIQYKQMKKKEAKSGNSTAPASSLSSTVTLLRRSRVRPQRGQMPTSSTSSRSLVSCNVMQITDEAAENDELSTTSYVSDGTPAVADTPEPPTDAPESTSKPKKSRHRKRTKAQHDAKKAKRSSVPILPVIQLEQMTSKLSSSSLSAQPASASEYEMRSVPTAGLMLESTDCGDTD